LVKKASAMPSPVTGTTVTLAALATDVRGAASLTYTCAATAVPSGASPPVFSINGKNAAKNTTATFSAAGTYKFTVRIADTAGLFTTSSVNVAVMQSFTSITISPASISIKIGGTQQFMAKGKDQFGHALASQPKFTWSSSGGKVTSGGLFTAPRTTGNVTVIATATAMGKTSHGGAAVTVIPLSTPPQVVTPASVQPDPVTGTTATLAVTATDRGGEPHLTHTWTTTTVPTGASNPTFSINGSNAAKVTTVTFGQVGSYAFTVTITNQAGLSVTSEVGVVVEQTFTTIDVTPGSVDLGAGQSQQFSAVAKDQFGQSMPAPPAFTWAAMDGTITPTGLYTAQQAGSVATATATAGTVSGTALVNLDLSFGDPQIRSLIQTSDADGSLDREDLIQILLAVSGENGVVDATELNDLNTLLADASTFHIPGYVQTLAGYVVDGNPANAHYQGQPLGNLSAGSTTTVLHDLTDKWFLGTDHPAVDTGMTYQIAAGSLFSSNVYSYIDEFQGQVGDCYLIATLRALAKSNPSVIENMIVPNGDNTWTVRFYEDEGTPDCVTVDRALPTSSDGEFWYADSGFLATNPQNVLWIPLVEKAYAEWCETGNEVLHGDTNSYSGITEGDPYFVMDEILGNNSAVYLYWPGSGGTPVVTKQELINLVTANDPLTAITNDYPGNGLVGPHSYKIIGYNSASDSFQLYNPWGFDQPPPLTFSQLEVSIANFEYADASKPVFFGRALFSDSRPRYAAILYQAPAASRADVLVSGLAVSNGVASHSMPVPVHPAKTRVESVGIKANADDWWLDALAASLAQRGLGTRVSGLKLHSSLRLKAIDAAFA